MRIHLHVERYREESNLKLHLSSSISLQTILVIENNTKNVSMFVVSAPSTLVSFPARGLLQT